MTTYQLHKDVSTLGDLKNGHMAGTIPAGVDDDNIYYVDGNNGNDGNDGKSWGEAFATIDQAVDTWNATIDWSATPMRYGCIFISPDVYAEMPSMPYYCYVIGTGVRGTDTMTEIHPATGSCFTGTMLGTIFVNLRFEVNTAVDCLNVGVCNNSAIYDCEFTNGAAVAATALSTDNCTHLTMRGCTIGSGQTTGMNYGLYFQGGSNKFAHRIKIYENDIFATTSGIWIQDTCTASQAMIGPHNMIWCSSGSSKGVDINDTNTAGAVVYGNWIRANDAIEHSGGASLTIGNSVLNGSTGAKETSGS